MKTAGYCLIGIALIFFIQLMAVHDYYRSLEGSLRFENSLSETAQKNFEDFKTLISGCVFIQILLFFVAGGSLINVSDNLPRQSKKL